MLAFFALGCVEVAQGHPQPPALRLDPTLATPVRTAIDVSIVPTEDSFEGTVTLQLDVHRATSVLWLNGTELKVHSGRLESGGRTYSAAILPGGSDFIGFQFAKPVPVGRATLTVAYQGAFEKLDAIGFFKRQDGGEWYVFSDMEPTDARRAFPCFDEPGYRIPWQVTLRVRKKHLAVSNMAVASEVEEGGGMKAVVFRETPPLPSYLVAIGVGFPRRSC